MRIPLTNPPSGTYVLLHNWGLCTAWDESGGFLVQKSTAAHLKKSIFNWTGLIFGYRKPVVVEKTAESGVKIQFPKGSKGEFFSEIFSEFLHFRHVLGHWESVKRVLAQKKI